MKAFNDIYATPGAFSWNELTTPDPKAACEFYGGLLGWRFQTLDMGSGPYHLIQVGECNIGGLMAPQPGGEGMPPCWGTYVTVGDADAAAAKAEQLGGKVLAPPFDIPNVGRMAVLQDPQGAVFQVIAYLKPA